VDLPVERRALRYIGVVVDDIKASYRVIRELKAKKIAFVLLKPGEQVPDYVTAVIICGDADGGVQYRGVSYNGDARNTVLRAISLSRGREGFELVVVGVDPGESTGIAVIADGDFFEGYSVAKILAGEEIKMILSSYPASNFLFRIGKGRVGRDLLSALRSDPRAVIEFVTETKMEIPVVYRRKGMKKDVKSALIIALTSKDGRYWRG
jgi:hypothetical protein